MILALYHVLGGSPGPPFLPVPFKSRVSVPGAQGPVNKGGWCRSGPLVCQAHVRQPTEGWRPKVRPHPNPRNPISSLGSSRGLRPLIGGSGRWGRREAEVALPCSSGTIALGVGTLEAGGSLCSPGPGGEWFLPCSDEGVAAGP